MESKRNFRANPKLKQMDQVRQVMRYQRLPVVLSQDEVNRVLGLTERLAPINGEITVWRRIAFDGMRPLKDRNLFSLTSPLDALGDS